MVQILTQRPPLFYIGTFFLVPVYSVLAQNLPANKTPNFLIQGLSLYKENPNSTMIIDRSFLNTLPVTIPTLLTAIVAVFTGNNSTYLSLIYLKFQVY